ncbi:MAG: hypothetical protein ABI954_00180 [Pyrinomonadaceae bacterium]
MQRKIHNQTLFVAALSVYLGLLIVGAPPQVLAQTLTATNQENQSDKSEETNKKFVDFGNKLKALAKGGKLDSFDITIQADAVNKNFLNQQIIIASGDKEFVDLLQELAPAFIESYFGQFSASQIDWSLRGDKTEINSNISFKVASEQKARSVASGLNLYFSMLREAKQNTNEGVIFNETTVTQENDQIFIVTRLPRAGLDAFLKSDEKAN